MIFELVDFCLNSRNGPFYNSTDSLHENPILLKISIGISIYVCLIGKNTNAISFIVLQLCFLYRILNEGSEFIFMNFYKMYLKTSDLKSDKLLSSNTLLSDNLISDNLISDKLLSDTLKLNIDSLSNKNSNLQNIDLSSSDSKYLSQIICLVLSTLLYKMYRLSATRRIVMVGRFIYSISTIFSTYIIEFILGENEAFVFILDLILTKIFLIISEKFINIKAEFFNSCIFAFGGVFYILKGFGLKFDSFLFYFLFVILAGLSVSVQYLIGNVIFKKKSKIGIFESENILAFEDKKLSNDDNLLNSETMFNDHEKSFIVNGKC